MSIENQAQQGLETNGQPNNGGSTTPQTGRDVHIIVNDREVMLHRGSYSLTDLKSAVGVPTADQLHLVKENGGLEKLDQQGRFTIKGGERFVSFAATGASS